MADTRSVRIASTIAGRFRARGTCVTYGEQVNNAEDHVKPWSTETRVAKTHQVFVFFQPDTEVRDPGSQVPTQRMTALMPKTPAFTPKTGDYMIDNFGKRYAVLDIVRIRPFGGDLLYKVGLSDAYFNQAEDALYTMVKGVLDIEAKDLPVYWPGKDASVEPDVNQAYVVVINTLLTNAPETLGRQAIWRAEGNLIVRFIFNEAQGEYERWHQVALKLNSAFQSRATGSGVFVMDVRRAVTTVSAGRYMIDVLVTYYFRDSSNVRRRA